MRYPIIDGFRGFFLLFMCVVHVDVDVDVLLGKLNHHAFGWVEDAQGFVFISGIVVGLVYGKALVRRGYITMTGLIHRRVSLIATYHGLMVLGCLLIALIYAHGGGPIPEILRPYIAAPVEFVTGSLSYLTASRHLGILPMYVVLMLLTPRILVAFQQGRAGMVIGISVGMWFILGQTHALFAIQTIIVETVFPNADMPIGTYFNIFAWQLLYIGGLWGGWRVAIGQLDLSWLKTDLAETTFRAVLLTFIALGLLDVLVHLDRVPQGVLSNLLAAQSRMDLSPIYLLAFAVDLYLILWLFVAGPSSAFRPIRILSALGAWLISRRAFVLLGQHAIQVFAAHMVIVYMVAIWLEGRAVSEVTGTAIMIGSCAGLYAVAYGRERLLQRHTYGATDQSRSLQPSVKKN